MQHLLLIIISMKITKSMIVTWQISIFYHHTLHIFIEVLFFRFLSWVHSVFFFTLQTLRKHCFINRLKSLIKLMKFLEFWYFLLYHYILFNTIFTETNSLWLIYKLVKALEIKNSVLFKFKFILLYVSVFFLTY